MQSMLAVPSTRGGCFIGKIYQLRPPTSFTGARADDQYSIHTRSLTSGDWQRPLADVQIM